ncbi:cadherin-like domain-containing protein [Candidatus Pacearchaeota archaeon]|nr:cadherin-like domain-containing protein [Candidatus Pacearchaeota archaeon]
MKKISSLYLFAIFSLVLLVSVVSAELNITILSPLENNTYGKSFQLLNVSLSGDEGISSCLYSLNGSSNETLVGDGAFWVNDTLSLHEGNQTIEVYCNDTAGVWFFASVNFTHDQTSPTIFVYSPVDGSSTNESTIWLNVSSNDSDVNQSNWKVWLNDGNETVFTPNITLNLVNGINNITVGLSDKYGNWNSTTLHINLSSSDSNETDTNETNETEPNVTVNSAPIALEDIYEVVLNTNFSGNVLSNDSDVDGDNLSVVVLVNPSNGSLTLNANGTFEYSPDENFSGIDFFSYTVSDGNWTSSANVSLYVNVSIPVVLPVINLNSGGSSGGGGSGGRYCVTTWSCTEWSACDNGTETRTCSYPTNFCTPVSLKPIESRSCTVEVPEETNETAEPSAFKNFTSLLTGAVTGPMGRATLLALLILLVLVGLGYWIVAAKKKKKKK